MKKHVKKVAVVTAMCGAMLMSSCTKREMLTPVAPPTEATQESPTDAPGIYIETSDGVVHNTGLRATASETREWTSPDGSIRIAGLGRYEQRVLENEGATVVFSTRSSRLLSGFSYRFEGIAPIENETQKEKDRVWVDRSEVANIFFGGSSQNLSVKFFLPGGEKKTDKNSLNIDAPEGTARILLRTGKVYELPSLPSFKTFLTDLHGKEGEKKWTEGIAYIPARFEEQAFQLWSTRFYRGTLYPEGVDEIVDYLIREARPEGWEIDHTDQIEAEWAACENDPHCGYDRQTYESDLMNPWRPGPWDKKDFAKDMEKYRAYLKNMLVKAGFQNPTTHF